MLKIFLNAFRNSYKTAVLGLVCGLSGFLLFVSGITKEWHYLQLNDAPKVQAEIVDIYHGPGRNGGLFPVFQFEANGKSWRVVSRQSENTFSGIGPFKPGDRVTVIFDPQDPQSAEIESPGMNAYIAQAIIGSLLVWLSFFLFRGANRNDEMNFLFFR